MGLQSGPAILRVGKQARVVELSTRGIAGFREDGGERRKEEGVRSEGEDIGGEQVKEGIGGK